MNNSSFTSSHLIIHNSSFTHIGNTTITNEVHIHHSHVSPTSSSWSGHLRHIRDPEHPLTLEHLKVVSPAQITVDTERSVVSVSFTPTVAHCSMATLIGLAMRVKLSRSLPARFKVDIFLEAGTHESEEDGIFLIGDLFMLCYVLLCYVLSVSILWFVCSSNFCFTSPLTKFFLAHFPFF